MLPCEDMWCIGILLNCIKITYQYKTTIQENGFFNDTLPIVFRSHGKMTKLQFYTNQFYNQLQLILWNFIELSLFILTILWIKQYNLSVCNKGYCQWQFQLELIHCRLSSLVGKEFQIKSSTIYFFFQIILLANLKLRTTL